MANDVEIGVAYERMKEASEFGLLLDDGAEVAKTTALYDFLFINQREISISQYQAVSLPSNTCQHAMMS
jgi:hypothetical protein